MMKTILAVLMLATTLLSVGCSNTSAGTGGNSVTKADLDKIRTEFRDELDALGVRVAEIEQSGKSGGVSKEDFSEFKKDYTHHIIVSDKFAAEIRNELNSINSRIDKLEKR